MSYLSPADWPDAELVQFIREVASHELKQEYGFPFFWADYEPDESPDTALIRMFQQEWEEHMFAHLFNIADFIERNKTA